MSSLTIQQRLDKLLPTLSDSRFLNNRGIGNEIGFYIFDYDPQHEPSVQQHLVHLIPQLQNNHPPISVLEINLYRIILKLLEDRNLLQKAIEMEKTKGNAVLLKSIAPLIRPDKVVAKINQLLQGDERLIFLTGVGASYPLLRSHTVLNNLHSVLDKTPLVMFFPGSYDGQELRLFGLLKDDNYYRAFPLIPR